jgi:hypothetical protein
MRIFPCLIAAAMLFSSCATIITGSRKTFGVDSTPQGANVEITNAKGEIVYRGQTPVTTPLRTGAGFFKRASYEIKLSMDGYQTKKIPVVAHINGWYFANILIGGAVGMLIVDPATGAMYTFGNSEAIVSATLVPNSTSSTSPSTIKIIDIRDVPQDQRRNLVKLQG